MIRETVFVSMREVESRPRVPNPIGGDAHPVFTLPAGAIIHGFSVDQNGLLELDASFPEPASP